jgi:hypothetical protein
MTLGQTLGPFSFLTSWERVRALALYHSRLNKRTSVIGVVKMR